MDVRREAERPSRVVDVLRDAQAAKHQVGGEDHCREHGQRRGQDAPRPASVEATEGQPAPPLGLVEEQAGDQETGDHEEHVHADEPAGGPTGEVVEHHEDDGDGAKPLDVLAEALALLPFRLFGALGPFRLFGLFGLFGSLVLLGAHGPLGPTHGGPLQTLSHQIRPYPDLLVIQSGGGATAPCWHLRHRIGPVDHSRQVHQSREDFLLCHRRNCSDIVDV